VPFRLPHSKVNWTNSSFLTSTAVLTFTLVPWYLYHYGIDAFQIGMFVFFCIATGLSITLGYHRLFSHLSFKASSTESGIVKSAVPSRIAAAHSETAAQ
jgi:stearoyl-CoA desaturase (delta-9 desaturase)